MRWHRSLFTLLLGLLLLQAAALASASPAPPLDEALASPPLQTQTKRGRAEALRHQGKSDASRVDAVTKGIAHPAAAARLDRSGARAIPEVEDAAELRALDRLGPRLPLERTPDASALRLGGARNGSRNLADRGERAAGPAAPNDVTCPLAMLAPGDEAIGSLAEGDCRLPQLLGAGQAPRVDAYLSQLSSRGRLEIALEGQGFEAGFLLLDGSFRQLASSLDTMDAGATLTLPAGDYYLLVTSAALDPEAAGGYRLSSSFTAEPLGMPCQEQPLGSLVSGVPAGGTHGISPADCRLFDLVTGTSQGYLAQAWSFALDVPGQLDLSLRGAPGGQPFAVITRPDGRPMLAASADAIGSDLTTTFWLPAGGYRLVAGSAGASAGNLELALGYSAMAAGACTPTRALPGIPLSGSLDEGDCHLAWLGSGSLDPSRVDLYTVVVPQYLSAWTIRLAADGFDPALRFYTVDLETWLQGVESPAGDALDLRIDNVDPATYILAVESSGDSQGEGGYTLELGFESVDVADCSMQDLATGSSVDGALEEGDCYLSTSYNQLSFADIDARLDQYRVTVARRGLLSATVSSSAVDMALVFYDAGVNYPSIFDDPSSMNASGDVIVQPGTYLILVGSATPDLGAYRLRVALDPLPEPDCSPKALAFGAPVAGMLEQSDCVFGDHFAGDFLQRYADALQVSLPARGRLSLDLRSAEIDSYLELYPLDGSGIIAFGTDWVPGVLDARIEQMLPAGDYLVVASSELDQQLGAYEIQASFEPRAARCSEQDLPVDASLTGSLDEDGCWTIDLPGGGYLGVPTDLYRLVVPQRGVLNLEMNSEDAVDGVDPVLFLYTDDWQLVAANDDLVPGLLLDAFLAVDVGPGSYRLVAATSTGLTGAYELVSVFEPEDYRFVTPTPGTGEPTATPGEPTATRLPGTATPTRVPPDGPRIYLPMALRATGLGG
ncbi:MAG: hypothetical protein H6648_03480 [Caldilineae bacterium]|nr:hypothetical protein [Caldilineae bacterium]